MSAESSTAPAPVQDSKVAIPTVEGKTEDEVVDLMNKAAKQIYFYFSDSNLPVDKFFFSLTACNPQGWVPIPTILQFKRMAEFKALGLEFVVKALERAIEAEKNDALLELGPKEGSDEIVNVRRKRPLEHDKTVWERTAYIKGFGENESESTSQEKIEEYIAQFGVINAVRKRRGDKEGEGIKGKGKGDFKGSCFVEFKYLKDLEAFVARTDLPKFADEDMVVMTKEAYCQMKIKEKGLDPSTIQRGNTDAASRDKKSSSVNRKFNAFREMEKLKHGGHANLASIPDGMAVKSADGAAATNNPKRKREDGDDAEDAKKAKPTSLTITYNGKEMEVSLEDGSILKPEELVFEENSVIKFSNAGTEGDWQQLKADVIAVGYESPFISYPKGTSGGTFSLPRAFTQDDLTKLNDAKIAVGGKAITWSFMEEPAQRDYWVKRAGFQGRTAVAKFQEGQDAARFDSRANKDGGRGRGGRGGRGGGGRGGGRGGRGGNKGGNRDRNEEKRAPRSDLPPVIGTAE